MEIVDYFSLLKRYKLVLIFVPLLSAVVAFFFVRNLPNTYISQTLISTGIVDQSQKLPDAQSEQESQVFIEFSNILTTMRMNKLTNQVSYLLMLHDLSSATPFRAPSKLFHDLNPSARAHASEVFNRLYLTHGSLKLWDKDEFGLNSLMTSMRYDAESINAKLTIFRQENSDFIHVDFESENPLLSAFVVNTMVKEFIDYHTSTNRENQNKSIHFLDSLTKKKKVALDRKTDELKNYKINNHILDIKDQASTLYTQISDYEGRLQQAQQDVIAKNGAIANIDAKSPKAANSLVNAKIISNEASLKTFTDRYIKSGYNPYYKAKVDSVQSILNDQILLSASASSDNPMMAKAEIRAQRLSLAVSRDLAEFSIKTIAAQIENLKRQADTLVPHEAVIQNMENGIETASKEYLNLQEEYQQASVKSDFTVKLRQVDIAMPGPPTSSKKMLIVANGAIISELICLIVLFVLFFLDDSIKSPRLLANKTKMPVLGYLNKIQGQTLDLRKLWDVENKSKMQEFKDLLRSIRFEIDQELHENKVLAITSLTPGEGKTLLAISLAYSYSIINKKVLLIDGNFSNPTISATVQPKLFIEDFFRNTPDSKDAVMNGTVSVLGNQGNDITLLEIDNERVIQQKFLRLKSMYDIIIIEVQDMGKMNKAKEWLLFADKTIGVFEHGQTVTDAKNNSVKYLRSLGPKFSGWIFNKAISDDKKSSK